MPLKLLGSSTYYRIDGFQLTFAEIAGNSFHRDLNFHHLRGAYDVEAGY
jgi:hypothetical protein